MSNIVNNNAKTYPNIPKKRRREESFYNEKLSTRMNNSILPIEKSEACQPFPNHTRADLETYRGCNINQVLNTYKSDYHLVNQFMTNEPQEKDHREKSRNETEESTQKNKRKDPPDHCSIPLYHTQNDLSSSDFDDLKTSASESVMKREGTKKRKKREPRRKFATLYHTPEGAEHAVDITRVCQSVASLNKLKHTEKKFLAESYQQMSDAKQELDYAKELLDQYQVQYDHHFQIMMTMKEKINAQQEIVNKKEKAIKNASNNVTEQELKVDCPWNKNYKRLCQYNELYGNIDLPTRCPEDKDLDSLCCWIQAQKQKYQDYREGCKITFKPYRMMLLEKLGIEWNVRNNLWNKHFDTLKKFKDEFGHVLVPTKTPPPEYKELAAWVVYQRDQYKSIMDEKVRKKRPVKPAVSLTPDRMNKLKEIGFVFNVFDERWKVMYLELKQSNKNYASFKKTSSKLHNWIERQRFEYDLYHNGQRTNKRCRLTPERIKLLDELGFPWKVTYEAEFDEFDDPKKTDILDDVGASRIYQSYVSLPIADSVQSNENFRRPPFDQRSKNPTE